MFLFSLHDIKAQIFHKPFVDESVINALRGFDALVNDPKGNTVSAYPDDFCLFKIGEFNRETGAFTPCLDNLGTARSVLNSSGGAALKSDAASGMSLISQ